MGVINKPTKAQKKEAANATKEHGSVDVEETYRFMCPEPECMCEHESSTDPTGEFWQCDDCDLIFEVG